MLEQEIQELTKVYRQILSLFLQNNLSQPKPTQELEAESQTIKQVKLSKLKQFAWDKLPNSALRDVILGEKEELDLREAIGKADIWLDLLYKEF
jgi:hypothetical protein